MTRSKVLPSIILLSVLGYFSCNTTKYLNEGEYFLNENEFVYSNQKIPSNIQEQLPYYIKLKPNKALAWSNRRWFYYKQEEEKKDNSLWRFIDNNWSELPAIVDENIVDRSALSMQNYLKKHGYFSARVHPKYDTVNTHHINVSYHVNVGDRMLLDSFSIHAEDSTVNKIIEEDWRSRILYHGSPVDEDLYKSEVSRIVSLMRNNGYPYFSNTYVSALQIDTSRGQTIGRIKVKNPSLHSKHQKFLNHDITVYPNIESKLDTSLEADTVISRIRFVGSEDDFSVHRKIIANKISLIKGEEYREENYQRTLQQIGQIPLYSYPTLKMEYDTSGNQRLLNHSLYLRENAKYDFGGNLSIFYSRISGLEFPLDLVGLNGDASLINRNTFGGAELLVNAISGTVEFAPFQELSRNSYSLSFSNRLIIPQFIRFPLVYRILDKFTAAKDSTLGASSFRSKLYRGAQTRINLDYNFQQRARNYRYHHLKSSFGYVWNVNKQYTFQLDHLGIDWWNPTILEDYKEIIESNPYLKRTFEPRLLTGVLLKNFRVDFNKDRNLFGEEYKAYAELETSGLEMLVADSIGSLMGRTGSFTIDSVRFAKYIKADFGFTYTRNFNSNHSLAIRNTAGIAISLDGNDIPYLKQFTVGGPFSIRAWPLRALGPGEFQDSTVIDNNLPYYQSGDFKYELNAEYRFNLFWYFDGAVFADLGNVWNLRDSGLGENTTLSWNFYKQMAIGSGLGIRFDYNYFIIRFDMAYPLRTPSYGEGKYWTSLQKFNLRNTQLNLAFGFPF